MVTAFVMVNVGVGWLRKVYPRTTYREKFKKITGVKEVYLIFGRYDLMVHLEASSVEEILRIVDDEIRNIPGVQATETFMAF
ncbi:MAG: Lrp/AsnC ligand binding domain-containing protein [Candidatus Bathyarchaeia archaeon]